MKTHKERYQSKNTSGKKEQMDRSAHNDKNTVSPMVRTIFITAAALLIFGLLMVFVQSLMKPSLSQSIRDTSSPAASDNAEGYQVVKLSMNGLTYVLEPSVLKQGVPVKMIVDMKKVQGCMRSIVIPEFGVRKSVSDLDNTIIFTPTKSGTFRIACSMNMGKGTFTVVNDGSASTTTAVGSAAADADSAPLEPSAAPLPGGACTMGANGGGCGCGA